MTEEKVLRVTSECYVTGHWKSMFVMDQITNVQFARIIFIAPQFVTGQAATTVMIQPHETEKKQDQNDH